MAECDDCGQYVEHWMSYCPECGKEIVDERLPKRFTLYASGDMNAHEKVAELGLPQEDRFYRALRHYPGEVGIVFELDQDLNMEPKRIEYQGIVYLPEEATQDV